MPRDFLVYTPAHRGEFAGDFTSPSRLFDLAVNDWTGSGKFAKAAEPAEYKFAEQGHKWPTIARLLPRLPRYKFYAFIDEDIDVTVDALNGLFLAGDVFGLQIYQGALSSRSHFSHDFTRVQADSYIRPSTFIEIMAPIFSQDALDKCAHTFTMSELGWGLEYLWNDILRSQGMAIVDRFQITHIRPVQSNKWTNQRGETAVEECARMLDEWNARK